MDSEECWCCGVILGYFGECTNPQCMLWDSWDAGDEVEDEGYTDFGDYDEQAYLMGEYDEF